MTVKISVDNLTLGLLTGVTVIFLPKDLIKLCLIQIDFNLQTLESESFLIFLNKGICTKHLLSDKLCKLLIAFIVIYFSELAILQWL